MRGGVSAIRIVKGDKVFHVHGDRAGEEGVWLAHGQVQGIYDAPVKTTWKTGAFQAGSTQKSRKWLHRDLTLGFHIKDTFKSWEFNDSEFRRIFDYEPDPWDANYTPTVIEVETVLSGVRKLDVLMYEAPDFDADIDPQLQQHGNVIFKLRAGDPFWYQEDLVTSFSTSASQASGYVTVSNPTDQVMYQKWVLSKATWTLPDYSWTGPRGLRSPSSSRVVGGIAVNAGAVVDLDRQELMFRSSDNTNLLAQLAGKFFEYPIPPYTPEQQLPVSYFNAPVGGASVQLRQPRRWSRPWGLESRDSITVNPNSQLVTFSTVGSFVYTIPAGTTHIDVVMIGGGGGGGGGTLIAGKGGGPGGWYTTTLVRGRDIPKEATQITGSVGAGGAGGPAGNISNGGRGIPTTARVDSAGWIRSAPSGTGSANAPRVYGSGAGSITYRGLTYVGGDRTYNVGQVGNPAGGGGAGGGIRDSGAAGGRGQAWFYAYKE